MFRSYYDRGKNEVQATGSMFLCVSAVLIVKYDINIQKYIRQYIILKIC